MMLARDAGRHTAVAARILRPGTQLPGRPPRGTAALQARSSSAAVPSIFRTTDEFVQRHIGPSKAEVEDMLRVVGCTSLDDLSVRTVPDSIRLPSELAGPLPAEAMTESEALAELRAMVTKNKVTKPLIGMGYSGTLTPAVILRNMIENPGWYTAYTPYQAEIAQGRLEMLLTFQTMVADLTGLPVSNASLLDEATAAAETMSLCLGHSRGKKTRFVVADDVYPQTLDVIRTRADALGVHVDVQPSSNLNLEGGDVCGVLLQYPNNYGDVPTHHKDAIRAAHDVGALAVTATDLLALSVLTPPGELGADIAIGSAQRFGVPLGFGGPHAAFMAVTDAHKRKIPGRIIGVSKDTRGERALRMALQTREQHIRRDKATSNICTAQALLANVAAAYAVYHGPQGLKEIGERVNAMARSLRGALEGAGYAVRNERCFDTLTVDVGSRGRTADEVLSAAEALGISLRRVDDSAVGVALDETVGADDMRRVAQAFDVPHESVEAGAEAAQAAARGGEGLGAMARTSPYLTHEVFHAHRSETRMLRFLHGLEAKDLSLTTSMIPLGSCTMKLNATSEMLPISWPEVNSIHPFAPASHTEGYHHLIQHLNDQFAEITGFAAVSCQPNSGAQGEYSGLMCIRAFHASRGEGHRNVCLIPTSAHGTNPASAVMSGMKVVAVKSDERGNVDVADLRQKATKHADNLAALMVTYPSTFGVFETGIRDIVDCVHEHGGQVYMDGANMNAQVGLTSPGVIGADVCHLNLHKTFCIPHGGGGPGVGSIGVAEHLAPFLPGHSVVPVGGEGRGVQAKDNGAIAAAPYGSASILPISWMYINMMGRNGLKEASQVAILNANYMAKRLDNHFDVLYRGDDGMCAHEFIVDMRPFKAHGIVEEDVAKRLIDYGFHAPTMSWPVSGTLMVEPTESEDKEELDRFCDALAAIRGEIQAIADGKIAVEDSPLKHAPHTADQMATESWDRPYSREEAVYPLPWVRQRKFWPPVSRIDNVYGDRHLICTCPSVEEVASDE